MTLATFKLPRKSISNNPRQVSRMHKLLYSPQALPEPEPRANLDAWNRGFSIEAAQDYYSGLGLPVPQKPSSNPEMPEDVTSIQSDQLGMLHAQFAAYVDYLESEVAMLNIAAAEEAAYLEHVEADIRLRKTGTVKDKDSKALNDERYIQAQMVSLSAEAKHTYLKARLRGYEKCAAALSREMSRRAPQPE